MPKPTQTGSGGLRLDPGDLGGDGRGVGGGRAGDAGDRDVVDEARGVGEHARQAPVVGRRGGEADEVQAGGLRRQAELVVLLRRQVDDDQSVDARPRPPRRESARRRGNRSGCSSPSAPAGSRRRASRKARTMASVRSMVWPPSSARWPARWIAGPSAIGSVKGMPSSTRSTPARGQALEDRERAVVVGVAGHHEGDEGLAALGGERREPLFDACHRCPSAVRRPCLGQAAGGIKWRDGPMLASLARRRNRGGSDGVPARRRPARGLQLRRALPLLDRRGPGPRALRLGAGLPDQLRRRRGARRRWSHHGLGGEDPGQRLRRRLAAAALHRRGGERRPGRGAGRGDDRPARRAARRPRGAGRRRPAAAAGRDRLRPARGAAGGSRSPASARR